MCPILYLPVISTETGVNSFVAYADWATSWRTEDSLFS
jgi:hypothetical protein